MSLVLDDFLLDLWQEAQDKGDAQWASQSFWQQLLGKYIFAEKRFLVSAEKPPSAEDSEHRVNLIIKDLNRPKPSVLLFIESEKGNAALRDIEEFEHQALDACATYLVTSQMESIKAMTAIGTKARLWNYTANDRYLTPLIGPDALSEVSEYIEAHLASATLLRKALEDIKEASSRPNLA